MVSSDVPTRTIGGDRGGALLSYVVDMKKMANGGKPVRFAGNCHSACTVYLALPSNQVCITPTARFGFHAPKNVNVSERQKAIGYMMDIYPRWVRSWISSKGGLDDRLKVMGYEYAWRTRPESARAQRDRDLLAKVRQVHEASKGVYGSPRIHAELIANGVRVGRHKIAQLMRSARLRGCPKRRYRVTTKPDPNHPVAHNLLKRNFTADAHNRRWAGDITYIPTRQGWLYLAVVIDLYSRRIVGWSMSRWSSRRLVIDALRMAVEARRPQGPLIHHSDRGGQYSSDDFRNELTKHGIDCSMSSTGNCYE